MSDVLLFSLSQLSPHLLGMAGGLQHLCARRVEQESKREVEGEGKEEGEGKGLPSGQCSMAILTTRSGLIN